MENYLGRNKLFYFIRTSLRKCSKSNLIFLSSPKDLSLFSDSFDANAYHYEQKIAAQVEVSKLQKAKMTQSDLFVGLTLAGHYLSICKY